MIEDTKLVLERCATVRNDQKKRVRAVNLLRKWQREGFEEELQEEKDKLERARVYRQGVDVGATNQRIRTLSRQLEEQSPYPHVSPQVRDALAKREADLRRDITQGMMDRVTYRKNPPGAAGQHTRWHKANKDKILEWKNIRIQLEPDSEDRDLANIEQFRPEMAPGLPGSFMPQAQIPGHHAMSPQAKAHFPETMGREVNSALEEVKQRESGNGDPPGPPPLPERICICGCEKRFIPAYGMQRYFSPAHRIHVKGNKKYPEVECFCGCGTMFTPTRKIQKFMNKDHKRAYFTRADSKTRRQMEREKIGASASA